MKITNVSVDIANASVSVTFEDGTSQVVTAPIAPATQGVSLEDLQKVEADVTQTQTDVEAAISDETPNAEAPVISPTE